jgi:predicted nucleic acid-binding protein
MKVMLDLNVILDVVQRREPHFGASAEILAMAARNEVEGMVASHCLTTLYYIVEKHAGKAKADSTIDWALSRLRVPPAGQDVLVRARGFAMSDFEDAVVAAIADDSRCRYVVTRNVTDFAASPVPALTPEEFLLRADTPQPEG